MSKFAGVNWFNGIILVTILVATAPAYAQSTESSKEQSNTKSAAQHEAQRKAFQRKHLDLSKRQAAARAREQLHGRVLKVEQRRNDFRVKMLQKSGRVISVDVDKQSGKVKPQNKKKIDP